ILPQNENLDVSWKKALGPNWKNVQERRLHTLGNLTLTRYNSEYSDRSFREKRDMEGGLRVSPLKLNEGLRQTETWDEEAIRARARALADRALIAWACPKLSEGILDLYRPKKA